MQENWTRPRLKKEENIAYERTEPALLFKSEYKFFLKRKDSQQILLKAN